MERAGVRVLSHGLHAEDLAAFVLKKGGGLGGDVAPKVACSGRTLQCPQTG
jgi:hypothetical protein